MLHRTTVGLRRALATYNEPHSARYKQSILPSGVNAPSATSRDRSQACNTAFNVRSFSAQDVGEDAEEATDENKNIRKIVEIDSMATPILAIRGGCVLASFRQACNTGSWADITV